MKVKGSNIARILADLDTSMDDVISVTIKPGVVSLLMLEDGFELVREYGVNLDA